MRVCARWRPGPEQTTTAYAKMALRHLARRYQTLDTEITQLDVEIRRLCHSRGDLDAVAAALNSRPRKTLGYRTPAEAFTEHLDSLKQGSVATTP